MVLGQLTIPIYIGVDRRETLAYHVLSHSIIMRSSVPVSITPLYRPNIIDYFSRPKAALDSTDFSNSRWVTPVLQQHRGWAIWLDSDMVCTTDIAKLWAQRNDKYSVMVRKQIHDASQEGGRKFLGEIQTAYERKNWSSLILFNGPRCKTLDINLVHDANGLFLHRFQWLHDDEIGAIEGNWNHLVGVHPKASELPELLHYTVKPPWFRKEGEPVGDYDWVWWDEVRDLVKGDNPLWQGVDFINPEVPGYEATTAVCAESDLEVLDGDE